jgi:hypothetical protein
MWRYYALPREEYSEEMLIGLEHYVFQYIKEAPINRIVQAAECLLLRSVLRVLKDDVVRHLFVLEAQDEMEHSILQASPVYCRTR